MKKLIMAAVLCFLGCTGDFGGSVKASMTETHATWLWNPWVLVDDEAGTLEFLEKKNVNKVYLQIDREIPDAVYQSFIEKASANGINIYALDGGPGWVAPSGYTSLDQLMNWVKMYQNSSSPAQRIAGVHLDVEPYLYSGWSTNQAATIKNYQSLFSKASSSTSALGLPLEADIPFWFDEITYKNTYGKGNLAEWIIAHTDSVTIMAYRDTAPSIIQLAENEVALAEKYKKPLVIGVETDQTSEGSTLTFYEEGEAYMNQELAKVSSHFFGAPGFGGIAVHHVGSWVMMKP
ncbi:hypothetical protein [Peribacillus kribbensis]|uniref:hypothetical protein n=1 Tax=Peribacillus kribbensis TaxID=356658 RepID=UPI0003FEB877|nr:hypothetical protein [Peribacillus kribbensis]